jgi:hypothetical protein
MNKRDVLNKIQKNSVKFGLMTSRVSNASDETRQILLSTQAALFAIHNPCGVLSSPLIEQTLLKIAASHSIPLTESYAPQSILHVFTRAFSTGGHTRVCERWIEACAKDQIHSVAILNQGHTIIPDFLNKAVLQSGGEIITLKQDTPLNVALELRRLASNYHFVVLHIHDVVPMLAFGTKEFLRPVMLFNHADHIFWLGGSIVDLLINFRKMSVNNNREWRGVERNVLLPLPSGEIISKSRDEDKVSETREALGFSSDDKIILTIGSSYKFEPFAGLDFIATIEKILIKNERAVFLIIGPSLEEDKWAEIIRKFPNRVKVVGIIPYSQIDSYLQTADIALEPFPLGSPTALIDAVQYGIPCVSLVTPVNNYDAFVESGILCDTPEELIERISSYLEKPPIDHKLIEILQRESTPDAIRKIIAHFMSGLNKQHQVYDINILQDRHLSEFELFVVLQIFISSSKLSNLVKTFIRRGIYIGICFLPVKILMYFYRFCHRYFLM